MPSLFITNVMVCSIDGKIALNSSESSAERRRSGFSCTADFQRLRDIVASCDVVFLGSRSLESEQGAFRVSSLRPDQSEPLWMIFTQNFTKINLSHPFWRQSGIRKSLVCISSFDDSEAPSLTAERQCILNKTFVALRKNDDVVDSETIVDCYNSNIKGLFSYLKAQGFQKIALLGGGHLNALFWQYNLVDRLCLTLSPFVVGHQSAPALFSAFHSSSFLQQKLVCTHLSQIENHIFLEYQKNSSNI